MRFLHLADLHLDTAFQSRSREIREELRRAVRTALERAVDHALREGLDAVLVAGDLFDGETLTLQTERFLQEVLSRLGEAGIQTIYATGNHDPATPTSPGSDISWPEGVTVLRKPSPGRVEVLRDGRPVGAVTGAGHASTRESRDLSRTFPRPSGSVPEVGLLHTQVMGARGAGDHHRYAPSELSHLRSSGHDYWALGHVHVRQILSETPPIHYPGNPQGRSPRETGPKGGLIVDLSRREAPQVEFLELATIRWEHLRLTGLEEENRLEGLARRIESAWEEARVEDPGAARTRWILRVELVGPSPLHHPLTVDGAVEELREVVGASLGLLDLELRTELLRPARRLDDHLDRSDVLGEALRLARSLGTAGGPAPSSALDLEGGELAGFDPAKGRELDDYLRELLDGQDTTLLDLLLEREEP